MKKTILLLSILLGSALARAGELHLSAVEPIYVVAPETWQASKAVSPTTAFRYQTYQIMPPTNHNAAILVSIIGNGKTEVKAEFADREFLKKVLRGVCAPYVASPNDAAKIPIKELSVKGGLEVYADFVDPDLVGKAVQAGNYKVSTPIILSLGSKYLITATIMSDEIGGDDYREAFKIVESIKVKE
jgi:hypothetical protein